MCRYMLKWECTSIKIRRQLEVDDSFYVIAVVVVTFEYLYGDITVLIDSKIRGQYYLDSCDYNVILMWLQTIASTRTSCFCSNYNESFFSVFQYI